MDPKKKNTYELQNILNGQFQLSIIKNECYEIRKSNYKMAE